MKVRTIGLLAAALLLGAFLLGCTGTIRVANPQVVSAEPGRLVGALITTEPLDLFDIEGYLNDRAGNIISGGVIDAMDSAGYEGKLYAVLKNKGRPEYAFEGVDGIRFFAAEMEDTHGNYNQSVSDPGISDAHIAVNASDEGTSVSLEGTIYVSTKSTDKIERYFVNPVYQEAGGRVYAMSGNSISIDDGEAGGGTMTVTLNEADNRTVGNESASRESNVKISIAYIEPPERITVVQMDGKNMPLDRKEYLPGETPETLKAAAGAEYLIVETRAADGTAAREIYSEEDESFSTFYCREDGFCEQKWTQIRWTKN